MFVLVKWGGAGKLGSKGRESHFLALLFAPLFQSFSSSCAFFAFSVAAFWAAASAFFALPATFLVFSPAAFLPAMFAVLSNMDMSLEGESGEHLLEQYLFTSEG